MRTLIKAVIAAAILASVTGTGANANACDFGCDDDNDLLVAILLSGDRGL